MKNTRFNTRNSLMGALAAMVGLVSGGCNKTEVIPGDKPIRIQTEIEALTRAPQLDEDGSGQFAANDCFTLFACDESRRSVAFDYTVGATTLRWRDLEMDDARAVNFSACYPKQASLETGRFVFDLEKTEEKDLLLAERSGVAPGSDMPVTLKFRHAMHRLAFVFTPDEDFDLKVDDIETFCTAKSVCTVDLTDNSLTVDDSETATFSAHGKTAAFLIVPQHPGDVQLEIRLGSITKRCSLDELVAGQDELSGGKQLTVRLTVKNGEITFEDFVIEGWGDQGSVDGEIIM